MKYNPHTHIVGKVYDLTQENMNALLDEIHKLNLKLKELHSDSLEDHQEYKRANTQLIKDLRNENARLQEQLRLTQIDNNLLMTENACYQEALEWIVSNQHLIILADNETHAEHFTAKAREALKGE